MEIIWELKAQEWLLIECKEEPNTISVSLNCLTDESLSLHFGSLGCNKSVFEQADKEFLDILFRFAATVANNNGWNVSICSLWDNLPYCLPSLDELDEIEDSEDRAFLEEAHQFLRSA